VVERERFTREEAGAKVGKRVKTLAEFSGVPKETPGQVTRADDSGIEEGGPGRRFMVSIQWDLTREPRRVGMGKIEGEPFLVVTRGKPLVDWFSKDEYEQYLEELKSEKG